VEDIVEDLAEDQSEVKLEEYHSWNRSSWAREPSRVRTDLPQEIGVRPPLGRKEAEDKKEDAEDGLPGSSKDAYPMEHLRWL
jgi:hypothetical protein